METRKPELRTVEITRYVTPLREGGSLPAIVEADDGFLYVLKFRGAGQGLRALIAELIGCEMARMAGLKVPETVLAQVDPAFGRTEPDEEIQDLLKASAGLNLGLHYLSGAISFDPVVNRVATALASRIVWLDALLTNVDRTARNTNMLSWNKELWLIDFGASLYFHHGTADAAAASKNPFAQVKDHVLLPWAAELEEEDREMKAIFSRENLAAILDAIPEEWLEKGLETRAEQGKSMYMEFLLNRISNTEIFLKEARDARKAFV